MKDNDIIKALHTACLLDPKNIFIRNYITGEITTLNMDDVLNLINRQQTEIERLKAKLKDEESKNEIAASVIERQDKEIEQLDEDRNAYQNLYCQMVEDLETAKSEAYEEFAERLKKSDDFYDCIRAIGNVDKIDYMINIIDNLVKEMVGEENV